MAKVGPKTKYNKITTPILIAELAKRGYTDAQMAKALGVDRATLHRWCKRYPELKEASEDGKEIADDVIVDSLYNRAKGHTIKDKKILKNPDGSVRQEITEREVSPDTTACIFWLKNRRPKEWRDKHDVEHSGEVEQSVIILPSNGRMMKEIPDTTPMKAIE